MNPLIYSESAHGEIRKSASMFCQGIKMSKHNMCFHEEIRKVSTLSYCVENICFIQSYTTLSDSDLHYFL